MSVKRFLDTNILVYAVDTSDAAKHAAALKIIAEAAASGEGVLSAQVLGEFFHATVVKRQFLTAAEARAALDALKDAFPVEPIDSALVDAAIAIHDRYQLAYWDSLVVAAANRTGCAEIVSEDMNHGQLYNASRVVNPFLSS